MIKKKHNIVIAIDGPAGSGKSTLAKALSEKLDIDYLDTGAMYRIFTLFALNNGSPKEDKEIENLLDNIDIEIKNGLYYLNGEDVTKAIREESVNKNVSFYASKEKVRDCLVRLQRNIGKEDSIVVDGRDIGTKVFPNAKYKFFITASVEERGKRRYLEELNKGFKDISLEKTINDINKRDDFDMNREHSPLKQAEDAILIDTTNKSISDVINEILSYLNLEDDWAV